MKSMKKLIGILISVIFLSVLSPRVTNAEQDVGIYITAYSDVITQYDGNKEVMETDWGKYQRYIVERSNEGVEATFKVTKKSDNTVIGTYTTVDGIVHVTGLDPSTTYKIEVVNYPEDYLNYYTLERVENENYYRRTKVGEVTTSNDTNEYVVVNTMIRIGIHWFSFTT